MTTKRITILWRKDAHDKLAEDRLQVEFSCKDFSFTTLDGWVRSRFGLNSECCLKYSRKGIETGLILYFNF